MSVCESLRNCDWLHASDQDRTLLFGVTGLSIFESLTANAKSDTELLMRNDERGDDFCVPREVDFSFFTTDREKAEALAEFVAGNQYGGVRVVPEALGYRVLVLIEMPITQHVICSVSGMMECLSTLFKVDYDGWGSVLQRRKS